MKLREKREMVENGRRAHMMLCNLLEGKKTRGDFSLGERHEPTAVNECQVVLYVESRGSRKVKEN